MTSTRLRTWLRRCVIASGGVAIVSLATFVAVWNLSPFPVDRLLRRPVSRSVTDREGHLLLKVVGEDGQWREPVDMGAVGAWVANATIAAEDERFWRHSGVDPVAVMRAVVQNVSSGRIASGASTVTMQVARMVEPRERTLCAKAFQTMRALQLERCFEKRDILQHYLNMAPYGGNIRGIQAASERYFAKSAQNLTLAESALLAGIPKSPERLRPDRHPEAAITRRGWVLARMAECGQITPEQLAAANLEPLHVVAPSRNPASSHAAWCALAERPAGGQTTIDPVIEAELEAALRSHLRRLPEGTHAAGVVIDIQRSSVAALSQAGGSGVDADSQVNAVMARRSPGSALKPFIYAAGFEAGRLAPDSMLDDVAISRAGWSPENFGRTFSGEVCAADALRRSLNVPAILVAEGVGVQRCIGVLNAAGLHLNDDTAKRAGLGLAVGTVEVSLFELTNAYATLGRGGKRATISFFSHTSPLLSSAMSEASAAAVSEILSCRHRMPHRTLGYEAMPWFCWKTGTSSGRRDAWALGHNGKYAIGIWIGSLSGTGRFGYLGAEAAEPVLAELFTKAGIASDGDPPTAPAIAVTKPLPRVAPSGLSLKVLFPQSGASFVAVAGEVSISPKANRDGIWFVNGRRAEVPVRCPPGAYEFRCISADGCADSVKVTVR
jgi:penicillin-binding protein 1C